MSSSPSANGQSATDHAMNSTQQLLSPASKQAVSSTLGDMVDAAAAKSTPVNGADGDTTKEEKEDDTMEIGDGDANDSGSRNDAADAPDAAPSKEEPGPATLPDESAHQPSPPPPPLVDVADVDDDDDEESTHTPEIAEVETKQTAQVPNEGARVDDKTEEDSDGPQPVVDEPEEEEEEVVAEETEKKQETVDDEKVSADVPSTPKIEEVAADAPSEEGGMEIDTGDDDEPMEEEKTGEKEDVTEEKTEKEDATEDKTEKEDATEEKGDAEKETVEEKGDDEEGTAKEKGDDEERTAKEKGDDEEGTTKEEGDDEEETAEEMGDDDGDETGETGEDGEEKADDPKEKTEEMEVDTEEKTKETASKTVEKVDTPSTRRRSTRGGGASTTPAPPPSSTRRSGRSSAAKATPKIVVEDAPKSTPGRSTRATRSGSSVQPATEPTPVGRRGAKRNAATAPSTEPPSQKAVRTSADRATEATPKSRSSRKSTARKSEETDDLEEEPEEEEEKPKAKKGRPSKTPTKKGKKSKDEFEYEEPPAFEAQMGAHGQVSYKPAGDANVVKSKYSLASRLSGTPKTTEGTPPAATKPRTSLAGRSAKKSPSITADDVRPFSDITMEETAPPTPKAVKTPKETPVRAQSRSSRATPRTNDRSLPPPPQMPTLTASEQRHVDFAHRNEDHTHLAVGCRVYALYGKQHYPAVVVSRIDVNSYAVIFVQDNVDKKCPRGSIIPLSELAEGNTLEAYTSEEMVDQQTVTITKLPNKQVGEGEEWLAASFTCDDASSNMPTDFHWASFFIVKRQEAQFRKCLVDEKASTLDPINVVEGRRSRRSVPMQPQQISADDEEIVTPRRQPKKAVKKSPPAKGPKSSPAVTSAPSGAPTGDWKQCLEDRIADCSRTMFDGMVVVLTSSTNREKDPGDTQIFVKREIKYLINALGGRFVDHVGVNDAETGKPLLAGNAYCVTDTYYRTTKYLLSLAAGARLLSHRWVLDSVLKKTAVDKTDYYLPAGIDFDTGNVIDQVIHPLNVKRVTPFGVSQIVMDNGTTPNAPTAHANKVPHLYKTWKPILEATGGKHLVETPELKDDLAATLYAVVDDDTDKQFVDRCTSLDIPLLTSEWLIACLIHNRCIPFDENARYKYAPTPAKDEK